MKALYINSYEETIAKCPKKRKPSGCPMCKWYDYYGKICHFKALGGNNGKV